MNSIGIEANGVTVLAPKPIAEDGLAYRRRTRWRKRGPEVPCGGVVCVFCRRTDREAYPSGWTYKLHYGATEPSPPRTLGDGTIRRYNDSHEDTKGHELHVAPDTEPVIIEFPSMVELWKRYWSEIPKLGLEVK